MKRFLLLFSILLYFFPLQAQYSPTYSFEFESAFSTSENLPFWFTSNKNGRYVLSSPASQLLSVGSTQRFGNNEGDGLYFLANACAIGSYTDGFNFHFNELGGEVGYWKVRFEAGLFNDPVLFSGLSSTNGFLDRSINARPYPKIRLSTKGFIPFFFWDDWFSFKAEYDEGILDDKRHVENARLHHKSLFFKFKLKENRHFTVGLNHYVMWGGVSARYGALPNDFHSYILYVTGGQGNTKFLPIDQQNIAGNQFGSYFFRFDIVEPEFLLSFYLNHFFEDKSGMEMDNWRDNLLGAYAELPGKKFLNKLLYEFMYTKHQSGDTHLFGVMRGRDNYFNHGVYQSGYTYRGYTMASPFFSPLILNDGMVNGIENNRLALHHFGFSGSLSSAVSWVGLLSYSHNLGTYGKEYKPARNQFSSLVGIQYGSKRIPFDLGIKLAADFGELYSNRVGVAVSLSRKW
jgi:hypothetical protein